MMFLFLFLAVLPAFSATNSLNTFEQTYPRDNTFCSYKGEKIEVMIRGISKFIEPSERGYGEYVFYRRPEKAANLMSLNEMRSDSLKFFLGSSPLCSKSHGYLVDASTIAVLFLKENRPFKDKLVIQLFDSKTLTPKNFIETDYPTDKARKTDSGFAFRTINENHNADIGKVTIEGQSFIYHEKDFPYWINYSIKGFEVLPDVTFDKFPWKKLFKTQDEFFQMAGWNSTSKKFSKMFLYHAVNHALRKECLLLTDKQLRPTGAESWKCQTI